MGTSTKWVPVVLMTLFGWNSFAADVDQAALVELEQRIRGGEFSGVHGVLVVHRDRTIAEWYVDGNDETILQPFGMVKFGPETLHDIRSVTKSVVSMLFGIALHDGAIKDLNTPVLDYFPEYPDLHTPERMQITLKDILSMTSGLRWDERTYPYTDPRNSEIAMDIAADPYRYVLTQTIDSPPGQRWMYSGGDVALAGEVIARAVKLPLDAYAQEKIFGPLDMRHEWSKNRGIPRAASGLRLTPRDMAKLGTIMLHGGRWGERQIVPAEWVATATSRHAQVEPDPQCGTAYGYFWWLGPGCASSPPTPWFAGIGNGGQRIWVVPSRDLVVVTTAGLYNDPTQGQVATGVFLRVLAAVPAAKP
jgi:CubicO group peptidase (beta-lactamase class C family)